MDKLVKKTVFIYTSNKIEKYVKEREKNKNNEILGKN